MITNQQKEALRRLPAVHVILEQPALKPWLTRLPRERITQAAAGVVSRHRRRILADAGSPVPEAADLAIQAAEELDALLRPALRRVINATGVVLHTNLGRALLSRAATAAMQEAALYPSNLEYRLESGSRGSRHEHVEALLRRLTGAEAALVVNNNAAAVFLVLRTLAREKEVIVSRGQLVEIGGSFRVSEIMQESGARLVEVGTTNKTHPRDVEQAITPETALLMKVHTSNFRIIGFTREVSREELTELGERHQLPTYEDLGSGVLYDLAARGIGDEPTVQDCIKAGIDVVSFSGDKLLGGPQAGIILGKKQWIDRMKKNQLLRSLRVDKCTLAGLEATLHHYLQPEEAAREIPTLRQLLATAGEIRERAERLHRRLQEAVGDRLQSEVVPSLSQVGGGSLPGWELDTWCVALTSPRHSAAALEAGLRRGETPVIARIVKEQLLLDLRTVTDEELGDISEAVMQVLL